MHYNPDKIRKISSEILAALERLEDLRNLSLSEFTADPHKVGSAKYSLIVAIEGAVDLCNHVIAKNGFRTPEDYADTFRVMEEKGAFAADFASSLTQMARFRNRLVHIYWNIDDAELHRIIATRLDDIRRFLKELGKFIGS
ncbi:DUF86 domain-containing protein [Geobacter sp.]|uniref:type VII toxin-antitoxin system HepT family RNase toxin n=1 Tax=Geobacter sp. TaxID=46610 RepID=UPI001AC115BD|nr:DUF86 domain-containing protein [Geobacter sp.]CAG0947743.1 hypothetical protein ANRL1_04493 [Anaerolineae bacterium]